MTNDIPIEFIHCPNDEKHVVVIEEYICQDCGAELISGEI